MIIVIIENGVKLGEENKLKKMQTQIIGDRTILGEELIS
jgi:hypothetical protein